LLPAVVFQCYIVATLSSTAYRWWSLLPSPDFIRVIGGAPFQGWCDVVYLFTRDSVPRWYM